MKIVVTLILSFFVYSAANAVEYTKKWQDINYVPCEGVGINSSGTVVIKVEVLELSDFKKITSLTISTTYPHGRFPAASISYTNWSGKREHLNLVRPWFPTIGAAGVQTLYLPRNKTSTNPSAKEQKEIWVSNKSKLDVSVSILYSLENASCASQFSTSWGIGNK